MTKLEICQFCLDSNAHTAEIKCKGVKTKRIDGRYQACSRWDLYK